MNSTEKNEKPKKFGPEALIQKAFEKRLQDVIGEENWKSLKYGRRRGHEIREAVVWESELHDGRAHPVHVDIARVNALNKNKEMYLFEIKQNMGYAFSQYGYLSLTAKGYIQKEWAVGSYMVAPANMPPWDSPWELLAKKSAIAVVPIGVEDNTEPERVGEIPEFNVTKLFLESSNVGLIILVPKDPEWRKNNPNPFEIEKMYICKPQSKNLEAFLDFSDEFIKSGKWKTKSLEKGSVLLVEGLS